MQLSQPIRSSSSADRTSPLCPSIPSVEGCFVDRYTYTSEHSPKAIAGGSDAPLLVLKRQERHSITEATMNVFIRLYMQSQIRILLRTVLLALTNPMPNK